MSEVELITLIAMGDRAHHVKVLGETVGHLKRIVPENQEDKWEPSERLIGWSMGRGHPIPQVLSLAEAKTHLAKCVGWRPPGERLQKSGWMK